MELLPDLIAWIIAVPPAVAAFVFAAEALLGLREPGPSEDAAPDRAPATVLLIPAHDEELGIAAMLERLHAELPPNMRALVVADNCSDRTAEIARAAGAEVIERSDTARRGKGYALAFGRDHLRADPPECVIVLDADCELGRADLALLARTTLARGTAVQAKYLLRPDPAAAPMVQVSSFAMAVKNSIRQLGLTRLGAPALLTGTGMAFPWDAFAPLPLDSGSLAEDLELGIALAAEGRPPRYEPAALVWSRASSAAATLVQRSRWEGGFIAMARRHGPALLARGLLRGRWSLFWLGLHVITPPLALLLFLNLVALLITGLLALAGATWLPLAVLAVTNLAAAAGLIGAWGKIGRTYLAPGTALRLPLYALWKLPIYLKLLRGGEKQWIRTERTP